MGTNVGWRVPGEEVSLQRCTWEIPNFLGSLIELLIPLITKVEHFDSDKLPTPQFLTSPGP